jgi:NADP-dependent 3-hydroxy acid dehydrogenase YdfG
VSAAGGKQLAGQTAIVTGASSGIGRATALALAGEGANVAVVARRAERLAAVVDEVNQAGGAGLAAEADVSDEAQVESAVARTLERFGGVHALVNGAGHGYFAPVTRIDAAKLDRILAVNLKGAILCAKHVVPHLVAQQSGMVVNVGSVSSKHGWAQGTPYVASKFALRGFGECLWHEVHRHNVRVLNLFPDNTDTEFFEASGVSFPDRAKAMRAEDVARVILLALLLPQGTDLLEVDMRPTRM